MSNTSQKASVCIKSDGIVFWVFEFIASNYVTNKANKRLAPSVVCQCEQNKSRLNKWM